MYIKGLTQCLKNRNSINVTPQQQHHHRCWAVTPRGVCTILVTAFILDYHFKDVYILEDGNRVSLQAEEGFAS